MLLTTECVMADKPKKEKSHVHPVVFLIWAVWIIKIAHHHIPKIPVAARLTGIFIYCQKCGLILAIPASHICCCNVACKSQKPIGCTKQEILKKAYIIGAHKYPDHLCRLISRLDDGNATFFVHIDKKVDIRQFKALSQFGDKVKYVERVASR
jgi:hypothetical protein